MVNYKQMIEDLGGIAYHHEQINSFGFGDITQITMDVETEQEPVYTKMYVVPGAVTLRQNRLNVNFNIIIMDIINADYSNQKEVMSDTLEILKDVWTILYQSYTSAYGGFSIDYEPLKGPSCTPFLEKYETILGGWTLAITLEQPFDYNYCVIPDVDPVFPNNSQEYSSYVQIVDDYKEYANLHEQINSFGFGEFEQLTMDIETKEEPVYPKLYMVPADAQLDSNQMNITFQFIMMDQLNVDLSNQRDVMNDMLEICKDLFARSYLSDYEAEFDAVCEPWLEKTETVLGGWTMTMVLTQPFDYNRCVLPTTNFSPQLRWFELDKLWKKVKEAWKNV